VFPFSKIGYIEYHNGDIEEENYLLTTKKTGLSTAVAAGIVIIIIAVAGVAAYYYLSVVPGYQTTSSSSSTGSVISTTPSAGKMSICVVFDVGGLGDRGFNDLAYAGMIQANKTLGVNYDYRVATTTSDFPSLFSALISEHCTLIVGNGFDMDSIINQSARANPNTYFAITDGDWPTMNLTNVIDMKWQEHIGSAIVGALSVAMTHTNTIGFLGGVSTGIIYKFWNGWKAGAVWASNYLKKNVTLLKQYAGSTFDYFDKPTAGAQIGTAMLGQGADIIFTAAGGTGLGTFNVIGQHDQQAGWNWSLTTPPPAFAIGVDADQDYYGTYQFFVTHSHLANTSTSVALTPPSFILTSEIKTVDFGVFSVMKAVLNHNFSNVYNNPNQFAPSFFNGQSQVCSATFSAPCHARGVWLFGLSSHSVGPTSYKYTSQYLTDQAKNVVAQITRGILNGTITIPENYNDTPI
jgi:basic membrane protein A